MITANPQTMNVAPFDTIGAHWIALTRQCLTEGDLVYDCDVKLLECSSVAFTIVNPTEADTLVAQFGKADMVAAMKKNFIDSEPQFGHKFGYGERIWKGGAASPYASILRRLQKKPEAKSAVFSMLQPGDDGGGHVPCVVAMDFKIRDGKVHLHYFARSQDVYKKSYADNIAMLVVLDRLARDLGQGVGSISAYIASAHLYLADVEDLLKLEPFRDLRSARDWSAP